MVPMRPSTIFRSRWMALLWAAGMIWLAYDVASAGSTSSASSTNAEEATDATGAAVNPDDERTVEQAIANL
jgi:hypothetical protein